MIRNLLINYFLFRQTIISILNAYGLIFWLKYGGLSFILSLLHVFYPESQITIPILTLDKISYSKRIINKIFRTNITSYRERIIKIIHKFLSLKIYYFNFYILSKVIPPDNNNIWWNFITKKQKQFLNDIDIPWDNLTHILNVYKESRVNKESYRKSKIKIFDQKYMFGENKPVNNLFENKPVNNLFENKPVNNLFENKPVNNLFENKPVNK